MKNIVAQAKEEYFNYTKMKLKYSTFETNYRKMNIYIFDYLEQKKIKKLKEIDSREFINWKTYINSFGFSYNYKSSLFYCFSDFLDFCLLTKKIKENVALTVGNFRNDEIKKQDGNIWTLEEFNKFISVVDDKIYHALFNFLYFTGSRKGEALALTFDDIDFNQSTININKTMTRYINNNTKIITSPKTFSSNRIIVIDNELLQELKALKELYNCNNNAFVFGNEKSISSTTLERKKNKYCDIAKVKRIKIHEFRHSHACLLFQNKLDIEDISKRLGHSSISMTMTTYLKYLPGNEKRVLTTLNSLRQI